MNKAETNLGPWIDDISALLHQNVVYQNYQKKIIEEKHLYLLATSALKLLYVIR